MATWISVVLIFGVAVFAHYQKPPNALVVAICAILLIGGIVLDVFVIEQPASRFSDRIFIKSSHVK